MSGHDEHGPAMATARIPCRRWRLLVLTLVAGAGCSVLFALLVGAWLLYGRRSDDLGERLPPGVLADYVPEDSAAVLAVNLRQLRQAPIGRQRLRPFLQRLIQVSKSRLPWLHLVEINPLDDLDALLISFSSASGGGPVLLARGRIDRSRFQVGPDKLQSKLLDDFCVWEYSDRPANQATLLALAGDTLIVSNRPSRVRAALRYAKTPQSTHLHDPILRRLMMDLDRRQCLWLAASIKRLGPLSEIDDYLLKMILRPLLTHAESVSGGIDCAEDLRAELRFSGASDEDAARLEADLKGICEAAPGVVLLGRQNELLLLLRLLAASQIRAEGRTILLHSRLTADQIEK